MCAFTLSLWHITLLDSILTAPPPRGPNITDHRLRAHGNTAYT